ncbi:MAG: PrsW family intramembrane metalloprotease [Eubacterium sp.]|nr:PrsW family intramembrane metalloprotease [Eubacterium sp.]
MAVRVLFWAAVIPPLFLLWKVYRLDKIEHEPIGLIAKLFILGGIMCFPAAFIESVLLDNVLANVLNPSSILSLVISNFIVIAGAEEGCKYLVLKKGTWKNPNFDYRFDAVVYSVAVTLGFAALENVMYVYDGGLSVAASRAVLSIPGHCIFGIYMGYYYGMAKQYSLAGDRSRTKQYLLRAVVHPMLLHGFYDFCLSTQSDIMMIIFFAYVIILDVRAYRGIKRLAAEDYRM